MFQWIQVLSRKSNGWNPKMVMPHTCNQLIFIASQICMIHTHTFLYKNDETKTVYNPETLFGGKGCVWAQIHVSSKQTSTSQKMHLTISCAHGIPRQVNIDRVCELMSSTWCVCTRDADVKKQTTFNIQPNMHHTTGFAIQPCEALLMLVMWHHEWIPPGISVCYPVARKSGHVRMISTRKKTTSIITSNFEMYSVAWSGNMAHASLPHLGRFWIGDLFGLGDSQHVGSRLVGGGLKTC